MKNAIKIFVFLFAAHSVFLGTARAVTNMDSDSAKSRPTEVPRLSRHEIVEKLQLTDDQNKKIRETRAAYRISVAKLDNQIKLKKVELENELDKPEPDQSQIDILTGQLGVLYGQRLNVKVKASIELEKQILTPQQADLLKTLQVKESSASDEILD
jgi:Spy/CpxP family protein refolding chaperone